MPVDIDLDLPDDLHKQLRAKAALENMSVEDYLLRLFRMSANIPAPLDEGGSTV